MKTLIYSALTAVTLILASCTSTAPVDRSKIPTPGAAPKIQIGQYQMFSLENGLKVIVVENRKLPRVSYSINLDIDPVLEGDKAGYTGFAGELLGAGTASKSKAQIDEQTDYLGASLSTSSDGIFGSCLKKHDDEFLALMSDVLLNPTFPQEELDKSKKQAQSSLVNEKTDPGSISSKIGSLLKYGKSHPYGEFMTESTLEKITRDDLVNYYNTFFKPNVAYLVIVGDITAEEAKAQANQYFGGWKRGNVNSMKYTTPVAPAANQVAFVPVPGAVQSVIDVTYPIDLKPGTQEAIVANVLNNILGGSGFQARLMQNLREDKAFTYGAYSEISNDELVGYFSAGASVRNEVTDSAVVEFLYEMERIVNEPVADSTLQTVKNIMTGSFARSLERPQTIANFAFNIEKYGLPKDYYETYLQKLNAITAADVQALAKKLIKPKNAYITIVGNKEVVDKLNRFAASGKVDLYNPDGTVFVDLKPVPAGVTAQSVIDAYVNALGGKAKISSIKSFDQTGKMAMGPMNLDMNVKMKDNRKLLTTVKMGAMDLMKQVFDGDKGKMSQMGQSQDLGPDEINDIRKQIEIAPEANYSNGKTKLDLKGIDIIDGEEAYLMEITDETGEMTTTYFSVKTGLKLKDLATQTEGGESMTIEVIYKDYKEFGGVKFPTLVKTNAGGQAFDVTTMDIIINPSLEDTLFKVD